MTLLRLSQFGQTKRSFPNVLAKSSAQGIYQLLLPAVFLLSSISGTISSLIPEFGAKHPE
jgi:hypothetical protein